MLFAQTVQTKPIYITSQVVVGSSISDICRSITRYSGILQYISDSRYLRLYKVKVIRLEIGHRVLTRLAAVHTLRLKRLWSPLLTLAQTQFSLNYLYETLQLVVYCTPLSFTFTALILSQSLAACHLMLNLPYYMLVIIARRYNVHARVPMRHISK